MITVIGIVAGEIWNVLEEKGKVCFSALVELIEREQYLIYMSIGWLAREGHIQIEKEDNSLYISLR